MTLLYQPILILFSFTLSSPADSSSYLVYECKSVSGAYQWQLVNKVSSIPQGEGELTCREDYGFKYCAGGVVDSQGRQRGQGYFCGGQDVGKRAYRKVGWF